jgi:hypothetical protein
MDSLLINKALESLNLDRNKYADRALLQCVRGITPEIIETEGFDLIGREVVELYLKVMRKRAHLHLGSNRTESLLYEQQTLECLINWIPNKDPDHEACAVMLKEMANKNYGAVVKMLEKFQVDLENRSSRDQRRKASSPRPMTPLGEILYEIVKGNPRITEKQLMKELNKVKHPHITITVDLDEEEGKEIQVDVPRDDYCKTYSLEGMRNQLSRMKEVINKENSQ